MSENNENGLFYEIEYDSIPVPGVGKFVLKPQKIEEPERDEIRELFYQMRDISRNHRSKYDFSRFFDRRVLNDNAIIFYQQAVFMKDFEDDYSGNKQLSQYFPTYQMMGYEQLRTYFTWRTEVRKGNVLDTSLSYAFLYIYELLSNIGVDDAQNGLDKLIFFWKTFKNYNKSIDKYVVQWLKDYYIYYNLPCTWSEFIEKNALAEHFPDIKGTDDVFDLFSSISKYDIRKSVFWSNDTSQMITDCFTIVINRIRRDFKTSGIDFDGALFRPTKKLASWKPFKDALFYNHLKQADRSVILSENEIYICKKNNWMFSVNLTTEKGRKFISYVMKNMESTLRKIMKYRFKLTAKIDIINEDTIRVLTKAGLDIEKIISSAVLEYHREATKTIVKVNHASLAKIRQEALITQNALIVDEQDGNNDSFSVEPIFSVKNQNVFSDSLESEPTLSAGPWDSLKDALNGDEVNALAAVLHGDDIKAFADECGLMLEVLADGINEKAMDYIGDSLLDEEFIIYDDYIDQVKELVE